MKRHRLLLSTIRELVVFCLHIVNTGLINKISCFRGYVLQQSDSLDTFGAPVWHTTLTLLFVWTITAFILIKGVKSLGKVGFNLTHHFFKSIR